MISMKDKNYKNWLNNVKESIYDLTVGENNIEHWDFLTLEVDELEEYKDSLAFDVKNMGYADYDEINKAFKKLGYENLSAYDFENDIYEICQLDNELIFHDIEDYMEIPFYAMGRMGGHWGVLCKDICDYHNNLIEVEINEDEIWHIIQVEFADELREYDDIYDIDYSEVADYAVDKYPRSFNFVADKNFVKHLNDAWKEIKTQSDYMQTKDYAEYIVERLTENM